MADKPGKVYLIGAGPGDPGLMTLKGLACLRQADVVIYDYLANPVFLEEAPDAEKIYVGKRQGVHCFPQDEIKRLLLEHARQGKIVARLKGGDPFIFGRGGEEALELARAGIPFEVVPGVTAAVAAAAYAGIPMTHRDHTTTLGFITGHEDPAKKLSRLDWEKLATSMGTLVFYMGLANLENICEQLVANGRSPETPVAVVRWATTPRQETLSGTLADIVAKVRSEGFKPPALIFIGEVVGLRETLRWFDNRPLFGKRVLVTRTADQAGAFMALLEAEGALAINCPMIEIVPPESYAKLDAALGELSQTDVLVLTSSNAVSAFFSRLAFLGYEVRDLKGVTVAVAGPKTAEAVQGHGLNPDVVADDYRAEGVIDKLLERGVSGQRVLYPRAELAREVIPTALAAAGARVLSPVAYRSRVPRGGDLLSRIEGGEVDAVTFTASSTVDNFVAMLGEDAARKVEGLPLFSIGPQTSETMVRHKLTVAAEASPSTLEGMVSAMLTYYTNINPAS